MASWPESYSVLSGKDRSPAERAWTGHDLRRSGSGTPGPRQSFLRKHQSSCRAGAYVLAHSRQPKSAPSFRIWKRSIAPWSNRFPPSSSWLISTKAWARLTSVRRSKRSSASPRRNGCKIRSVGIRRSILTTSSAGAWKRLSCFCPASRCVRRIASCRATTASSGCIAKPR